MRLESRDVTIINTWIKKKKTVSRRDYYTAVMGYGG